MKRKPTTAEYLTVTQAAARLMVQPATIRLWIDDGLFPNTIRTRPHVGAYRIPIADIEKFEEDRKVR